MNDDNAQISFSVSEKNSIILLISNYELRLLSEIKTLKWPHVSN
jgi:hypothetical protein